MLDKDSIKEEDNSKKEEEKARRLKDRVVQEPGGVGNNNATS